MSAAPEGEIGGPQTPLASRFGPGGRFLLSLSKYVAIAGGLVFVAIVAMEIVSIVGRKVFSWTVPGDVELLQMGAAFASAAFFAYCHMVRGNVKVDFFTAHLAPRRVALLDAFGSLLVGLFGALIAWRTAAGALSIKDVGETSAILGWPVWIAQALMVPSFALLAVAGLYLFVRQLRIALDGRKHPQ
ncbi:MAG TPA: TRAP transporter small permease [Casimicrobiaceae bacterium]|jgi:TRAP-type mannitol/chloroaromatic compound transport system permease small subunit